jgi:hypothetical protein
MPEKAALTTRVSRVSPLLHGFCDCEGALSIEIAVSGFKIEKGI